MAWVVLEGIEKFTPFLKTSFPPSETQGPKKTKFVTRMSQGFAGMSPTAETSINRKYFLHVCGGWKLEIKLSITAVCCLKSANFCHFAYIFKKLSTDVWTPWGCSKTLCKRGLCSCFGPYEKDRHRATDLILAGRVFDRALHLMKGAPDQASNQGFSGPVSRDIAILLLRYLISRNTFSERLSLYMGRMGSICHFSRALPASI